LDVIKKENLLTNATEMGNYIMDECRSIPGVKDVRGRGLMIGLELDVPCTGVRTSLLEDHKMFTGSSSDKNTIRILPALNIGKKEIDLFLTAFKAVMSK